MGCFLKGRVLRAQILYESVWQGRYLGFELNNSFASSFRISKRFFPVFRAISRASSRTREAAISSSPSSGGGRPSFWNFHLRIDLARVNSLCRKRSRNESAKIFIFLPLIETAVSLAKKAISVKGTSHRSLPFLSYFQYCVPNVGPLQQFG